MDTEGIVKSVDGIYKNILEKFNPGAKVLITSAKSYLKALHNSSASSKNFVESLAKLAVNAHEGGTSDIGKALMDLVGVFSSIEDQHTQVLKAFYCDFILPLENNLEKDTKVVQLEQKKFSQLHKQRIESFNKATQNMKKHRKKKNNAEKELKCIQALEEEKKLLDNFCEQSIKNALVQERRRYGFVLERSVHSMAKHWSQYFQLGHSSIDSNIEWWTDTASTREMLPINPETSGPRKPSEPREPAPDPHPYNNGYGSVKSSLMKSQSAHASTGSLVGVGNDSYQMSRHVSEHSLASSPPASKASNSSTTFVTAIFPYMSSGENQLSLLEGDKILVIGEKTQGWQFGENMRTNVFGWFPVSYVQTESERKSNIEATASDHSRSTLRKSQDNLHEREPSGRGIEKFNPPMELPPPPPSKTSDSARAHTNGSATTNFSKTVPNGRSDNANKQTHHGIYSSNDSGFDNEVPPAPEVDYSDDDDLPKKIPIRESMPDNANVHSDHEDMHENYSKSSMNLKQSNSFGNLTDSNRTLEHGYNNMDATTIKRNKSFWRFSKSEDVLEGFSLWKHRDLVPIERSEQVEKEMTLKKPEKQSKKMETLEKKNSRMEETRKMDKRNSNMFSNGRPKSYNENYKDQRMHYDDEIYDESPKRRNDGMPMMKQSKPQTKKEKFEKKQQNSLQDTNFYDDDSQMVIKTVKRKEILKQYYSSGTDTELSSSDPYDCIIVDDHLVASTSAFRNRNSYAAGDDSRDKRGPGSMYSRSNKNESISGTLLPRTKLSKSTRGDSSEFDFNDRMNTTRSNKNYSKSNWSNLWPDE